MTLIKKELQRYMEQEYGKKLQPSTALLKKYQPQVLEGYLTMRNATLPMKSKGEGLLSRKVKELVITAVEVALGRGEKGKSHARKAIRAGATPEEVSEVLAICIWLAGMATFVDSGSGALQAAIDEAERVKKKEPFHWRTD